MRLFPRPVTIRQLLINFREICQLSINSWFAAIIFLSKSFQEFFL